MQFVYYSEKTVAQCLTAINARMQVKETATRPALDGWVEKGGSFSISLTAPVIGKFTRRTMLKAKVERESGVTVIRGSVPTGASRESRVIVFAALALVALTIFLNGNALVALLLLPFAAYLYIPMRGDFLNSAVLLDEMQRTLKARPKPPKKSADAKTTSSRAAAPAARTTSAAAKTPRPAAAKAAPKPAVAKPAAAKPTAKAPAAAKAPKAAPAGGKIPTGPESEFPPMTEELL